MREAPTDARSEPSEWLRWPTSCVWPPDEPVIIDIALIDEDEVTRRAFPDIDHDVRILRVSSPWAPATRADRPPPHGARSRAASPHLRRAESGCLGSADDLIAFIEEV